MKKQPAYYQLLMMSDQLRGLAYKRQLFDESYQLDELHRKDTGKQGLSVKLDYTSISHKAVEGMSKATLAFIMSTIFLDLKMYNLLWSFVPQTSQERAHLKELLDSHIIFRTETTHIYLVNPVKIWRGAPILAVECTKHLLREHRVPSVDLIRDLRPKDVYQMKTSADQYNLLRDGFSPNMLEEEHVPYGLG
jgi:hypothetical protein